VRHFKFSHDPFNMFYVKISNLHLSVNSYLYWLTLRNSSLLPFHDRLRWINISSLFAHLLVVDLIPLNPLSHAVIHDPALPLHPIVLELDSIQQSLEELSAPPPVIEVQLPDNQAQLLIVVQLVLLEVLGRVQTRGIVSVDQFVLEWIQKEVSKVLVGEERFKNINWVLVHSELDLKLGWIFRSTQSKKQVKWDKLTRSFHGNIVQPPYWSSQGILFLKQTEKNWRIWFWTVRICRTS
jgi:hypothetical protein